MGAGMGRSESKVTLKDIGRVLGLSARAVSNGLNNSGRLAPETRRKIIETSRSMGYVPNAAARSLVTQRSCFIGALIPYLNRSFFCNIIAGVEEIAEENGFMMLLDSLAKESDARKERVLNSMMQHNVGGIILYPRREDLEMAPLIRAMGVPVIQVMEHLPEFGGYAVTMDNFKAACDAVNHLLERGHDRIACLVHDTENFVQNERLRGYLAAMGGRPVLRRSCAMTLEAGWNATRELLTADPDITAVFASSDFAALGALRAGLEMGRRVPERFAVVGFSDVDMAANQALCPLSTIAQPKEETGRCAARMLFDILKGKKVHNVTLPAPLIIRKSS